VILICSRLLSHSYSTAPSALARVIAGVDDILFSEAVYND
jgi:hypothetical protein